MAKHLKNSDIRAILNTIYGWSYEKLTWDALCVEVSDLVGKKPTRQSLYSHKEVVSAFSAKKSELKLSTPRLPRPSSLAHASQRIKNLESQINDLEQQNSRLLEYLTILQYNAYKQGMTEAALTCPLPVIDRNRTS